VEMDLTDLIIDVCKVLNEEEVEYLVVGGTAVAFHGYFRWSKNASGKDADKLDLDIWYNPLYPNYFRLLNAIEKLGHDVSAFREEQTLDPHRSYFKLNFDAFTLDFLPSLKGLSKFRNSYESKETVAINGIDIYLINFDDLITDKSINSRPKDLEDIKMLKAKNKKP
jgi:predicted nucleotidyltransferase